MLRTILGDILSGMRNNTVVSQVGAIFFSKQPVHTDSSFYKNSYIYIAFFFGASGFHKFSYYHFVLQHRDYIETKASVTDQWN